MELRPYQKTAVEKIEQEWGSGHRRTLIVMATGTGKTCTFAEVARRMAAQGKRTLILAHRGELLDQAADKINMMTGLTCSREQAESTSIGEWNSVTVGSVQTLMQEKRLSMFKPDRFDCVIVDEAHHAVSDSYRRVLDYFDQANVLGVTATADRADRRGLSEVFDSMAFEYGMADAIHDGYLCPLEAQMIPLKLDISSVSMQSGDYAAGQLGDALEPYLDSIADEMAERCQDRKTVVFLPLVRTAKAFADMLNARGLSACEVDGQSPDRAEILSDFANNRYKVLCNSMLLCLDEQTEILTTRGFVGPDEIRDDDLIANWNFDGSVFFEKPHEIVKRPLGLDEHMTSIDSRTINLRVTNTHRMIVSCGANRSNWKKIAADKLRNGHLLPTCGVAKPLEVQMPMPPYERLTHKRVESGELYYTHPSDLTLDECRFIGFFLAEGTITRLQSGGIEYKVSQVKDKYPEICKWFDNVIDSCGFNCVRKERFQENIERLVCHWSFCRGTGHGTQSRNGLFRIEPYLNHDGSELFWGMNEAQFDALIEGFWYGDGFHGTTENGMPRSIQIRGCYQKLFDLWCAIGSVRGWRCAMYERPQKSPKHNTQYEMRLIKNKPLNISYKTEIVQETYAPENVWCVRTTSKNIITRRNGRVVVMGNTEGWDCPDVDCIVVLRPTKSRALYQQMIGRGTRLAPGKEKLLLLDFLWMTGRHDLCRPASLLGASAEVEARVSKMVEDAMDDLLGIDLLDAEPQAEQDVQTAREEALAAELEKMRHRKAQLVDPLQYALSICDIDLQNYEPTFAYEMEEPSEKQIKLLERRGIDPTGMTAGMASKMIDSLIRRQDEGMATPKQVRMLERKGFVHPGTWTFEQASKMMARLASNRWMVPAEIDPATYVPEGYRKESW